MITSEYLEVLKELGYNLKRFGNAYRSNAVYRDGNNPNALCIYENGLFVDYVTGEKGNIEKLIQLTLKFEQPAEVKKWIQNKVTNLPVTTPEKPTVKTVKTFPKDETLLSLLPVHDYWVNRGISVNTLTSFKGGLVKEGRMKDRYCFPIFNSKEEIIGLSGRLVVQNDKAPKWKHLGEKTEWKFPLFLNFPLLKDKKEVILVESIGDGLSLWECGIQNFIVTFGVDISISLLNLLLALDPNKIIIALNNDSQNNSVGNVASEKLVKKLTKYFDTNQVKINLPKLKDFNEMLLSDKNLITEWNGLNG
jgi:5S rRNA maturation endonuclease (ribonuclease M5)